VNNRPARTSVILTGLLFDASSIFIPFLLSLAQTFLIQKTKKYRIRLGISIIRLAPYRLPVTG